MKYKVTLNEKTYEVEVEKGSAILLEEYPFASPSAPQPAAAAPAPVPAAPAAPSAAIAPGEVIASPMPGTVLSIKVQSGMTVKKGDTLLVLEAMKMENEIRAEKDATIVQVVVNQGASVDTGAALIVVK